MALSERAPKRTRFADISSQVISDMTQLVMAKCPTAIDVNDRVNYMLFQWWLAKWVYTREWYSDTSHPLHLRLQGILFADVDLLRTQHPTPDPALTELLHTLYCNYTVDIQEQTTVALHNYVKYCTVALDKAGVSIVNLQVKLSNMVSETCSDASYTWGGGERTIWHSLTEPENVAAAYMKFIGYLADDVLLKYWIVYGGIAGLGRHKLFRDACLQRLKDITIAQELVDKPCE